MGYNEDALCLQQIYSHLGVEAYGEDIQEQAVKEIDRLKNKERKKAKQFAIKKLEELKKQLRDRVVLYSNDEHCYLQKGVSWEDVVVIIGKQIKSLKGEE